MKIIGMVASWIFGLFFILFAFAAFINSFSAGLIALLAGLLLLPPVTKTLKAKVNFSIPWKVKSAITFFLFVLAVGMNGTAVEAENEIKKQQAAQEAAAVAKIKKQELKKQLITEFNAGKAIIYSSIEAALANDDIATARATINKYLSSTQDAELIAFSEKLREKEVIAQEKGILTTLKTVPSSALTQNASLYKKLSELRPDNLKYKDKYKLYTGKIAKKKQKELAAQQRQKRIEDQFSAWDGSHRYLEQAIQQGMHNPDSYDHVKTVYWDKKDHLIVQTTFRGSNAFGAIVTNSVKAQVALSGQVLAILD